MKTALRGRKYLPKLISSTFTLDRITALLRYFFTLDTLRTEIPDRLTSVRIDAQHTDPTHSFGVLERELNATRGGGASETLSHDL